MQSTAGHHPSSLKPATDKVQGSWSSATETCLNYAVNTAEGASFRSLKVRVLCGNVDFFTAEMRQRRRIMYNRKSFTKKTRHDRTKVQKFYVTRSFYRCGGKNQIQLKCNRISTLIQPLLLLPLYCPFDLIPDAVRRFPHSQPCYH